ncbi:MAG: acyl carrier protein [Rhodanobacteraceae bacterium]|nr:acyl carrier protein [Rhodanobacteraceae bacterium]
MQALELEIKTLIIETLGLEDLKPEDIDALAPLFVDGLGLDSIDALDLGLAIQRRYGIHMSADAEETRQHFRSVRALAALIGAQRAT